MNYEKNIAKLKQLAQDYDELRAPYSDTDYEDISLNRKLREKLLSKHRKFDKLDAVMRRKVMEDNDMDVLTRLKEIQQNAKYLRKEPELARLMQNRHHQDSQAAARWLTFAALL